MAGVQWNLITCKAARHPFFLGLETTFMKFVWQGCWGSAPARLQGCKAASLFGDWRPQHLTQPEHLGIEQPQNARGARRRKPPSCGPRHVDRRRGPKAWEEAGEANSLGQRRVSVCSSAQMMG